MRVLLTMDARKESGGTPLLMHNERLADPLDDYTRSIAKISKKRGKTDADHIEIGHLEFLGGLYQNGNGPCIPAGNVIRCLEDGGKMVKKGTDVLRGVVPLADHADLAYDGPRNEEELWAERFWLRKTVGIQKSRTMRTRPFFAEWSASLPVEVDPSIFDPDMLADVWRRAGRYAGIGDRRRYGNGRFLGTLTEWPISTDVPLEEAAWSYANLVRAEQIKAEDVARSERVELPERLVKAAIERAKKLAG